MSLSLHVQIPFSATAFGQISMLRRGLLSVVHLAMAASATAQTIALEEIFPLAGQSDYSQEEMVANVGGEFPNASAVITYALDGDSTTVDVEVIDAVPDTYFTVWLRLARASPLTGAIATPLASPSDLAALAPSTPATNLSFAAQSLGMIGDDGSGAAGQVNGFLTDASGNGRFSVTLDFPLMLGGSYPFDELDASLTPVSFGKTPFAIRVVSHAIDQVGHGLISGKHEMWFQTTVLPVPEPSTLILAASAVVAIAAVARCRPTERRDLREFKV